MSEFEPPCNPRVQVQVQLEGPEQFRAAPLTPAPYSLPGHDLDLDLDHAVHPELHAPSGPRFDPRVHLQLQPPTLVKDLSFQDVIFPYSEQQATVRGQLAYTQPFRVLSDEGVAAAREAIFANQERLKVSSSRISHAVRGLGCVSNFHRDMAHCSELTNLFSALARDEVCPHTFQKNISHSNIGFPETGRPVDKWHTDSTDYVVVIILSDLTDMQGGELQVLQLADSRSDDTFARLKADGVPSELVETVRYTGPGYAIFMQGSKILHTVRGVLAAREPRVSLVNSYMSTRVFGPDTTRFSTYVNDKPVSGTHMDFCRHKAWRVAGQLQYIRDSPRFIDDDELLKRVLRNAAAELLSAVNALDGKPEDKADCI